MAGSSLEGINLLLVGRSGNGKSSTGNSILGRKGFTPHSSTSTIDTYEIKAATTTIKDVPVAVVEGPGLGDTDTDITHDGQSMIRLVKTAMTLISYKFHALLVVLKYGVRFTNQEKEAVKMIKAMFGEDVIKNYGIIVMTYGDSFDLDMESDGVTFEKWCDDQTGDVRVLFDECDKRCVLFDNRSKDEVKTEKQIEQLLNLVSGIKKNRLPYNNDDFNQAEPSQRTLVVKGKLPELNSKTECILANIHERLREIKNDQLESAEELQKLALELQTHKDLLKTEDMGTGLVGHLLTNISITETRIQMLISIQSLKKKNDDLAEDLQQQTFVRTESDNEGKDDDKKGFYLNIFFVCLAVGGAICFWRATRMFPEKTIKLKVFPK